MLQAADWSVEFKGGKAVFSFFDGSGERFLQVEAPVTADDLEALHELSGQAQEELP